MYGVDAYTELSLNVYFLCIKLNGANSILPHPRPHSIQSDNDNNSDSGLLTADGVAEHWKATHSMDKVCGYLVSAIVYVYMRACLSVGVDVCLWVWMCVCVRGRVCVGVCV